MNRIEKQQVVMNESIRRIREGVEEDIKSGSIILRTNGPPVPPCIKEAAEEVMLEVLTKYKIAYIAKYN